MTDEEEVMYPLESSFSLASLGSWNDLMKTMTVADRAAFNTEAADDSRRQSILEDRRRSSFLEQPRRRSSYLLPYNNHSFQTMSEAESSGNIYDRFANISLTELNSGDLSNESVASQNSLLEVQPNKSRGRSQSIGKDNSKTLRRSKTGRSLSSISRYGNISEEGSESGNESTDNRTLGTVALSFDRYADISQTDLNLAEPLKDSAKESAHNHVNEINVKRDKYRRRSESIGKEKRKLGNKKKVEDSLHNISKYENIKEEGNETSSDSNKYPMFPLSSLSIKCSSIKLGSQTINESQPTNLSSLGRSEFKKSVINLGFEDEHKSSLVTEESLGGVNLDNTSSQNIIQQQTNSSAVLHDSNNQDETEVPDGISLKDNENQDSKSDESLSENVLALTETNQGALDPVVAGEQTPNEGNHVAEVSFKSVSRHKIDSHQKDEDLAEKIKYVLMIP